MGKPRKRRTVKIKKTGQPITIHLRQKDKQASKDGKTVINLQFIPHDVVILHPSFCIPLIVQDKQPLTLYILTDKEFYELYEKDEDPTKPLAKATINKFLKLYPWDTKKTLIDETLYKKGDEQANIKITYLKDMWPKKTRRASSLGKRPQYKVQKEWFIEPDPKDFQGSIRAEVRDYYLNKDMGHVFRIELQPAALQTQVSANNLYDLSWLIYAEDNPLDPANPYFEAEDVDTQIFLKKGNNKLHDKQWVYPYKINGTDFKFEQADLPIENYHPVYVTDSSKTKLNLGHLTDVHVSSRQHAFTKGKAQMIPGADTDTSPPIQTMTHTSFDALKDLMDQFGEDKEIDMLVVTGDLIDYNQNFNPASTDIANTGQLWEAMYLGKNKKTKQKATKDLDKFPHGIDYVTMYSLFKYFYDTHKKPILLLSGNHEGYRVPYGISPRKGKARPNYTIPADHNLTFYEAITLYGPDYGRVLKNFNFHEETFNWFYNLFTPLTDYYLNFGDQCLIGLEWGEDENFFSLPLTGESQTDPVNYGLTKSLFMSGFLPRAPGGVSDRQVNIIEQALKIKKDINILLTHFTFVSYNLSVNLLDGQHDQKDFDRERQVNINDFLPDYNKHDSGTFQQNRVTMYRDYLAANKFDYTLAGHSHRAGLYQVNQYMSNGGRKFISTRGYDPASTDVTTTFKDNTKVLVSACGGPIAIQNYNGELQGFGLESPSGSYVKVNGTSSIGIIKPDLKNVPTSQPRFAVPLDFMDIIGKELSGEGVFTRFESSTLKKNEFAIHLNPDLPDDVSFIESLKLKIVIGKSVKTMACSSLAFYASPDAHYQVEFSESEISFKEIRKQPDKGFAIFLSIKFKADALTNRLGYKQYNYASPWNIQIEVRSRTEKEKGQTEGYYIRRHKLFGEVPDLEWRSANNPSEYNFDWDSI